MAESAELQELRTEVLTKKVNVQQACDKGFTPTHIVGLGNKPEDKKKSDEKTRNIQTELRTKLLEQTGDGDVTLRQCLQCIHTILTDPEHAETVDDYENELHGVAYEATLQASAEVLSTRPTEITQETRTALEEVCSVYAKPEDWEGSILERLKHKKRPSGEFIAATLNLSEYTASTFFRALGHDDFM